MRLILVRHGQTPSNVQRLLDTAVPGADLTDLGRQQAERVPTGLADEPVEAVYASTLVRTQQTAGPLAAALGLDVQVRDGLREITAGDLEPARRRGVGAHLPRRGRGLGRRARDGARARRRVGHRVPRPVRRRGARGRGVRRPHRRAGQPRCRDPLLGRCPLRRRRRRVRRRAPRRQHRGRPARRRPGGRVVARALAAGRARRRLRHPRRAEGPASREA
nr:histidine phosphatase family protein [Angustibacter aerolatus]